MSIPSKIMVQVFKKSIVKHLEGNKVIRNGQQGFIKSKSCLINLISFNNTLTGSMDKRRATDVVYLILSSVLTLPPMTVSLTN